MGVIVFVLFVWWLVSEAVKQAKLDETYAKQGMVSPRMEAKHGREKATALVAKYGFWRFLGDAWRDYWPRRTQALISARDAKAASGRVRVRDRLAAARQSVRGWFPNVAAVTEPEPVPDPPSTPPVPDPPPAAPEPVAPEPTSDPSSPTQPGEQQTMATTGEVTNYETAIAVIDEMIQNVQGQIDSAQTALSELADAKAAVDALQQSYAPTAEAAGTKLDHEAALGLDGTTIGHAATTVDALPVGAVDTLYDALEAVEALTRDRLTQAETALASLEAERAHLVATYGDAHTTVAGNLGGDARFLDSGGGVGAPESNQTSTPTPQRGGGTTTQPADALTPAEEAARLEKRQRKFDERQAKYDAGRFAVEAAAAAAATAAPSPAADVPAGQA